MSDGNAQRGPGELLVADAVVSAVGLRGRLEGVTRVRVRRGAIVTPAARDLLRERRIDLSYRVEAARAEEGCADRDGDERGGKTPLAIGVANTRYRAAELLRVLKSEPIAVRDMAANGLIDLVAEMTAEVAAERTLGLLLTDETAAAICLANRQRNVRAAPAASRSEALDAARSIGANLLIVSPLGRSLFEMKALVAGFCKGWPRGCPEFWKGRL